MSSWVTPVDYYDRLADTLAAAYDTVTFEAVHGPLLLHLPAAPADVLDVGAGAGRDALALQKLGYRVTAVEPAPGLRAVGEARTAKVRWADDRLPELASLAPERSSFDFIFCSAVLMSLPPAEVRPSFRTLARLLRREGKLVISVRPPAASDAEGIVHKHSEGFLNGAAAAAGLKLIDLRHLADALGRDHRWSAFVYRHACRSGDKCGGSSGSYRARP